MNIWKSWNKCNSVECNNIYYPNNVDEIINGKVWTNFFEVLKNESITVPKKCYQKCTNNIKVHPSRKRTSASKCR